MTIARLHAAAVGPLDADLDRRIDQAEGKRGRIEARDDTGLARHQRRLGLERGRHDGIGGEVAGAAEILQQGGAHRRLDHQDGQG